MKRLDLQRRHEEYWAKCWVEPLRKFLRAEKIQASHLPHDPPDVEFCIWNLNGHTENTWGEITATYYHNYEAKWLWDHRATNSSMFYVGPDENIAVSAVARVKDKISKYDELVGMRGKGHLLVLLNSPMTTHSTRAISEKRILNLLGRQCTDLPFQSLWLAYRLPETTEDETEDPQFAFSDESGSGRRNLFKCIKS